LRGMRWSGARRNGGSMVRPRVFVRRRKRAAALGFSGSVAARVRARGKRGVDMGN
jgi:hypothetical protein